MFQGSPAFPATNHTPQKPGPSGKAGSGGGASEKSPPSPSTPSPSQTINGAGTPSTATHADNGSGNSEAEIKAAWHKWRVDHGLDPTKTTRKGTSIYTAGNPKGLCMWMVKGHTCPWKIAGKECCYNHNSELINDTDRAYVSRVEKSQGFALDNPDAEAKRILERARVSANNITCWNCGKPGHHSRDCTEPRKGKGKGKGKSTPPGLAPPPTDDGFDPWQKFSSPAASRTQ